MDKDTCYVTTSDTNGSVRTNQHNSVDHETHSTHGNKSTTVSTQTKNSDEIRELERFIDKMSAEDETNAIRLYERMALELKAEVSFLRKLNQATLFQDVSMNQASNSILRDEIMYLRRELQTKNNFIKLLVSSGSHPSGTEIQNHLSKPTSSNLHQSTLEEEFEPTPSGSRDESYIATHIGDKIIDERIKHKIKKSNIIDKAIKRKIEVIGDFMLNNIQVRELSKLNDVRISYFSGCKSPDLLNHIKPSLPRKPDKIIIHVGTNDLMSDDNMLYNVKKIIQLVQEESPTTELAFSSIIIRKDREDLYGRIKLINCQLSKYCIQHDVRFIDNSNITESCLDISNVHLNRKGNSLLAQNFLNHITDG